MPATGSDTRMYAPRSESNLGYSKDDDDYGHGVGDPEQMEQVRDKKLAEKEKTSVTEDLPHLQLSVPKPEPPMMPPMMDEEEEEPPMMDDQFNEGQQFGAMTGMPDMGNLSIGNATGTMPAPGGMLATGEPINDAWSSLMKSLKDNTREEDNTARYPPAPRALFGRPNQLRKPIQVDPVSEQSYPLALDSNEQLNYAAQFAEPRTRTGIEIRDEQRRRELDTNNRHPDMSVAGFSPSFQDIYTGEPMNDAWSSLMKSKLDDMGSAKDKSWRQPQFEIQPGGAEAKTANPRRAKRVSRNISPAKKRGLDRSPLSVHRTHLGVETKQPLRLFPQKYGQQQATQSRRKLMGNVPQIPSSHGIGAETDYNPRTPSIAGGGGAGIKMPKEPRMQGQSFAKSIELIKSDMEEVRKKMNYMQFTQMRRLMRDLKDALERKDRSKKGAVSSGPGEKGKAGHREAQNSTTRPEGATEDLENDPKNWGAPSTLFAAPGSGRVG